MSSRARSELTELSRSTGTMADFWVVVVQESRELSNLIARETGVRHESPQVLLFHRRLVSWTASHGAVSAQNMESALRALFP